MKNSPLIIAKIFSVVFLLVTVLGFTPNLLFKTNVILVIAHLVLTLVFFFAAYLCTKLSIGSLQTIGITYILISGIGFVGLSMQINGELLQFIYMDLLSYLQFAMGIILCASGTILKSHQGKTFTYIK